MASVAEIRKMFQEQNNSEQNGDSEVNDDSTQNEAEETTPQVSKNDAFAKLQARFQAKNRRPETQPTTGSDQNDIEKPKTETVAEKIARLKKKQLDGGKVAPQLPINLGGQPFKKRTISQQGTETVSPENKDSEEVPKTMTKYKACNICDCPLYIKHPLKDACKDCDHPHPQVWVSKKTKLNKPKVQPQMIQFGMPPVKKPKQEEQKGDVEMKYDTSTSSHRGDLIHPTLSRPSGPRKRHTRTRTNTGPSKKMPKIEVEEVDETKGPPVYSSSDEEEDDEIQTKSIMISTEGDTATPPNEDVQTPPKPENVIPPEVKSQEVEEPEIKEVKSQKVEESEIKQVKSQVVEEPEIKQVKSQKVEEPEIKETKYQEVQENNLPPKTRTKPIGEAQRGFSSVSMKFFIFAGVLIAGFFFLSR